MLHGRGSPWEAGLHNRVSRSHFKEINLGAEVILAFSKNFQSGFEQLGFHSAPEGACAFTYVCALADMQQPPAAVVIFSAIHSISLNFNFPYLMVELVCG